MEKHPEAVMMVGIVGGEGYQKSWMTIKTYILRIALLFTLNHEIFWNIFPT